MGLRITHNHRRFQSAPPVKGAIPEADREAEGVGVSIRAPREGGDGAAFYSLLPQLVSIRAPREGGDRGSLESFPAQGKKRVFREP